MSVKPHSLAKATARAAQPSGTGRARGAGAGPGRAGVRVRRLPSAKDVVRSFAQLRTVRSADERHALVVGARIPSRIVVEASEALDIPQGRVIDALGLREATFYRWLQSGQPIAPEKNELIVRLAEFTELAARAFGAEAKGKRWLSESNVALSGATPLSLLESSYGAERVRQALSVIEYGGVA